jgi:predicted nucleic-acid-binding protein
MASNLESLDTNVFLRLILDDDSEYSARAEKMLERESVQYLIFDQVIIEMVYILERQKNYRREFIGDVIISLFDRHNIEYNGYIFSDVVKMYLTHPKLSFVDCYLSVLAGQKEAVPLWTFDRKLARQSDVAKEIA